MGQATHPRRLGPHRALAELATGAPLANVLTALVESAEEAFPDMRCSILLVDAERPCLRLGAAPSLPEEYNEAIDGYPIGPSNGSCGTAAYRRERVVVEDVLVDPKWAAARDLVLECGFRASWSEPVLAADGTVLGTFAMYYDEPRLPTPSEVEFIETRAHLAGVAISIERTQRLLRTNEERFRELAEHIQEVFWLTDWTTKDVLYVSPAYETIWGRSCTSLYEHPEEWLDAVVDEDHAIVLDAFERAGEGDFDVEYRIVRPGGTRRWIRDRAFPIRDEHGNVIRVAGLSYDITYAKRVEEELRRTRDELARRSKEQIATLTSELLLAEESERRRLAVELHDGPNQDLALASMKIAALRQTAENGAPEALAEIAALVDRANAAARSLTFQLSPPILHDLGFEAAVQWLVEHVGRDYGVCVELRESGVELQLGERVRVLLFRAVRELLINVAKHSEAESASVDVGVDEGYVRIAVADDGVAFDCESAGQRGLGLSTIRERLTHLGGRMDIESQRGRGTRVTLIAPLESEDSVR